MLKLPDSPDRRSAIAWTLLRLTLAGLLAAHGWARELTHRLREALVRIEGAEGRHSEVLGALVQEKRLQQVQEAALLQSRLKQVQSRLSADKARQAQQKTWQQQAAHVQALSAQQRSWEALHQAL